MWPDPWFYVNYPPSSFCMFPYSDQVLCFVAATCPPLLRSDPHLLSDNSDRYVDNVVRFHCEEGWHLGGSITSVTCRPDGTWSAPQPHCVQGGIQKMSLCVWYLFKLQCGEGVCAPPPKIVWAGNKEVYIK